MLIADSREPDGMKKDCDAVYDLKKMYGVGDYAIVVIEDVTGIEKRLLFERKTAGDFVNTTFSEGRLNDQLDGVDGLIFEKMFIPKRSGGWWLNMYLMLNGVAHHHPVFYTLSSKQTINQLRIFERKLKSGEWGVMKKPIVLPPMTLKENEEQVRCLMGFPGLGEKRANDILKHYGTLEKALQSIETWADDVDGIGMKTQKVAAETYRRQVRT